LCQISEKAAAGFFLHSVEVFRRERNNLRESAVVLAPQFLGAILRNEGLSAHATDSERQPGFRSKSQLHSWAWLEVHE
jgi:hypothetical protein